MTLGKFQPSLMTVLAKKKNCTRWRSKEKEHKNFAKSRIPSSPKETGP